MHAVNLDEIRIDGDTQPRETIDPATVDEYAEVIERGERFPPPIVYFDGQYAWLPICEAPKSTPVVMSPEPSGTTSAIDYAAGRTVPIAARASQSPGADVALRDDHGGEREHSRSGNGSGGSCGRRARYPSPGRIVTGDLERTGFNIARNLAERESR